MYWRISHIMFPLFLFSLWQTPAVLGQGSEEFIRLDQLESVGAAHYVFAKKGQATNKLLVLGNVGSPGVYQVGVDIDLDELLALSGGMEVTEEAKITVRLYREGSGRRNLIYEAQIDRVLAEPGLYPPLRDGDVLTVESKERNRVTLQTWLSILTGVSTVALLINTFTSN